MRSECIKKEDAVEAVWKILNGMGYSEKHNDRLVEEVDAILDDIPAADVRPVVRGKWIPVGLDDMDEGMFKCSECGSEHFFPEILLGIHADNFCSNCGAMMEES